MPDLSPAEQQKQIAYRDARITGDYDSIWQSTGKCVFCDLREKYIVLEENGVVLTVSLFAYIDGNLMIIPRRHVAAAKDLTQAEWDTIRKFTYIAKKIIRKVHGIKGVNYVLRDGGIVANSTVSDHLHMHAIPFDAPDLITWNYRRLKYTPLENVALYKKARKQLVDYDIKFQKKYTNSSSLPIFCDVLILKDDELLMMERSEDQQFIPATWSIPGGRIDDFSVSFEEELAREIKEETGLSAKPTDLKLYASRTSSLKRAKQSKHLKVTYPVQSEFVWNTYIWRSVSAQAKPKAGDDAKTLHWVKLAEAHQQPLTPGLKATILQLQKDERHHAG